MGVFPEQTFYSMIFFSFTVCIYLLEGCYFHNVNEKYVTEVYYIKKLSFGLEIVK